MFYVHVRMGVYDLVLTGPRTAEVSWTIVGPFLRIFEMQKRDIKNRQKTLYKYCFRDMRLPDGPKMTPKSALFYA